MEQELDRLRADLKCWERKFAASHDGRKAGREDIKQHTEIGQYFPRRRLGIASLIFCAQRANIKLMISSEDPLRYLQYSNLMLRVLRSDLQFTRRAMI